MQGSEGWSPFMGDTGFAKKRWDTSADHRSRIDMECGDSTPLLTGPLVGPPPLIVIDPSCSAETATN